MAKLSENDPFYYVKDYKKPTKKPKKKPVVQRIKDAIGMTDKGSREAREVYKSGLKKGKKRPVPRVVYNQTSKQVDRGQINTTEGKGQTVSTKKILDNSTKQISSTKRNTKFGRPLDRIPGILKSTPASVFLGVFLNSSDTNMVDRKIGGKSVRIPDSMSAKMNNVDHFNKTSSSMDFDAAYNEASKMGLSNFRWDGREYEGKDFKVTQDKVKKDEESGKISLLYKGSYLGSRPQTVKEIKDDAPPNNAPRSGTRAVPLASGGLITRRGPIKRK